MKRFLKLLIVFAVISGFSLDAMERRGQKRPVGSEEDMPVAESESKRVAGQGPLSSKFPEIFKKLEDESGRKLSPGGVLADLQLFDAVRAGDLEGVKAALAKGAVAIGSVPISGYLGTTLLHLAIESGNEEIVRLLLDRGSFTSGIFFNFPNKKGWRPLHVAVENNNANIVKMLLAQGALVNVRSDSGISPIQLAAKNKNREIALLLINAGAQNKEGIPILDIIKKRQAAASSIEKAASAAAPEPVASSESQAGSLSGSRSISPVNVPSVDMPLLQRAWQKVSSQGNLSGDEETEDTDVEDMEE